MTNQEAIDILKPWRDNCKKILVDSEYIDAMEIAIKHLEAQIPIKPSPVPNCPTPDVPEGAFFCPICSEELSDDFEFCPLCGKKIDWND